MAAAKKPVKLLIVGESVYKIHLILRASPLTRRAICAFRSTRSPTALPRRRSQFEFMHNHDISLRFPFTLKEMQAYDVIVISDAPADSFSFIPIRLRENSAQSPRG